MSETPLRVFLCNGAELPKSTQWPADLAPTKLTAYGDGNVRLLLPKFNDGLYYFPDRTLDLLELAAYIFAADRRVPRGRSDAVEYESWARSFHFVIRVRDYDFWAAPQIISRLQCALTFMTGDKSYAFTFQPGHHVAHKHLFSDDEFNMTAGSDTHVMLFSGGLDSLAGAIARLEATSDRLCLVSHRSQPGTMHTQRALVESLSATYEDRVKYYGFTSTLAGVRSAEETQRSRAFLYSALAFAVAQGLGRDTFHVYENGVTALNFPRREDQINARASRTAHPKTLCLISHFLSAVAETDVRVQNPFLWTTKADAFRKLAECGAEQLTTSTVSCSHTFQKLGQATHCGQCFQCVDRRFAAHSAEAEDIDHSGLYAHDFVLGSVDDGEARTSLVDYVRQAQDFASSNPDHFCQKWMTELNDVVDYVGVSDENCAVERVWELCKRHGSEVENAINRMRTLHDKPFAAVPKDSFLEMIGRREYLKEPVQRLIDDIKARLGRAIPAAFHTNPPKDEPDFNDKVGSLLVSWRPDFKREHPTVHFACANAVPDHSLCDLLIESKYIRGSTSPSKASEGIAADLTKYPQSCHILFCVYDPQRAICDDSAFKRDFEAKGPCTVCIIR